MPLLLCAGRQRHPKHGNTMSDRDQPKMKLAKRDVSEVRALWAILLSRVTQSEASTRVLSPLITLEEALLLGNTGS